MDDSTSTHPAPATASTPVVVTVTGANGLVGARTCARLSDLGVAVRAVVRRPGTAPRLPGVEEVVGDFADAGTAARITDGAHAVVSTVHPMGSDRATQQAVGVEATAALARAAGEAGVERFVHVSTAAVYDRSPGAGDVTEASDLVGDDGGDYPVTKREVDAALADMPGRLTRVLVRPPAILGSGETSIWNTLRPRQVRSEEQARHTVPDATFAWVHVDDLAALLADLAAGRIGSSGDPEAGPVPGGCTPVNVAAVPATQRDYLGTVAHAVGVEPVWDDGPGWTGRIVADRAHRWGWQPEVGLAEALAQVERDASAAPG